MKKSLFISLSAMALMCVFGTAYAKLYPRDGIPKSDCLEMDCPSGVCWENDEDEHLHGECCPFPENLPKLGEVCTECGCATGLCFNGKCGCEKDDDCVGNLVCNQESRTCECPTNTTKYTKPDGTIDCCDLMTSEVLNGICQLKCVPLFKYSANLATQRESGQLPVLGCCEGNLTTVNNTPVDTRGYKEGGNVLYGCCPAKRTAETICCKSTEKALSTGCCDTSIIYTENGEERCCLSPSFVSGNKCLECLVDYGRGEGACPTILKPICNSDHKCESCPSQKPYFYNGKCYRCEDLPSNQLSVHSTPIVGGAKGGRYTVVDWTIFPVDAELRISSLCVDDYLKLFFNYDENTVVKNWFAYNVYCYDIEKRKDSYIIPANTPFKLRADDIGVGNVDWQGSMTIHAICN